MNELLQKFEDMVSSKTILLMYEPGAGGDFLTTLLSHSPDIYGNSSIDYHDNGRIKVNSNELCDVFQFDYKIEKVFDDYKFFENRNMIEILLNLKNLYEANISNWIDNEETNEYRYISKLHPYIYQYGNDIVEKLNNVLNSRYKYSKKILLTRETDICIDNHLLKNDSDGNDIKVDMYSDEWFDIFNKVETSDILHVSFRELITHPKRTLNRIASYANLQTPIQNEEVFKVIEKYMKKQKHIEKV